MAQAARPPLPPARWPRADVRPTDPVRTRAPHRPPRELRAADRGTTGLRGSAHRHRRGGTGERTPGQAAASTSGRPATRRPNHRSPATRLLTDRLPYRRSPDGWARGRAMSPTRLDGPLWTPLTLTNPDQTNPDQQRARAEGAAGARRNPRTNGAPGRVRQGPRRERNQRGPGRRGRERRGRRGEEVGRSRRRREGTRPPSVTPRPPARQLLSPPPSPSPRGPAGAVVPVGPCAIDVR